MSGPDRGTGLVSQDLSRPHPIRPFQNRGGSILHVVVALDVDFLVFSRYADGREGLGVE